MRTLIVLAFLFVATNPAFAADGWFYNKNCTRELTSDKTAFGDRSVVYFCVTSAATLNSFSNVLSTEGRILFVTRIPDTTQTTGGSGEVKVFEHNGAPGATVSASTGLDQRAADPDGDGVEDTLSLNGAVSRGAINGFTAAGITLQITALPASGEQMVITVTGVK